MIKADYACAILVRDGLMLLAKRSPQRRSYADCWDVVGGKVEAGETIAQALSRELREEIGIVPVRFEFLEALGDEGDRGPARYHFFVIDEWSGGEPHLANHEHTELRWFRPQDACKLSNLAFPEYPRMFEQLVVILAARASRA